MILRGEAVETAHAGDRCHFTGTLIVVPDISAISLTSLWCGVVGCGVVWCGGVWCGGVW